MPGLSPIGGAPIGGSGSAAVAAMVCGCCIPPPQQCEDCCSCNEVLGLPPYEPVEIDDISFCGYSQYASTDTPCSLVAIGNFAGSFPSGVVVSIFGSTGGIGFGWLKQSAIDDYEDCSCKFAVLVSVQERAAVSGYDFPNPGDCGCIAYSITGCYNYRILKYRCDTTWEDVTDELLSENRDCGTNDWPTLPEDCPPKPSFPPIPDENICTGPFTGCEFP